MAVNKGVIGLVCDSGPLIHRDEKDFLGMRKDLEPRLVPGQVWHEAARHRTQMLLSQDLRLQRSEVAHERAAPA